MNVYVNTNSGINVQVSDAANRTVVSSVPVSQIGGPFYPDNNPSGFITTNEVDAIYYPRSNPSGYATGISANNFVTTGQSGQFYPRDNPSGYTTLSIVDASYYPRTNPSGYLTNIDSGAFVTTGQTGTQIRLHVNLTSGVDQQTIAWGQTLPTRPTSILCEFENDFNSLIYSHSISSVTTSGFVVNFSDVIDHTGYYLNTTINK